MADLSADRPLPLPEKIFSEEDVELVAVAITNASGGVYDNTDGWARYVLTALAAAGRLLPPDAEHREEWAWRVTRGDFEMGENDPSEATREEAVAIIRMHCAHGLPPVVRWRLLSRQVITGPWVEVDRSATADA